MDPEFAEVYAKQQSLTNAAPDAIPFTITLNATTQYVLELFDVSTYIVEDKSIPVEGGQILARCIVPSGDATQTYPVLVWFHAGGWIAGDLDQDDNFLRNLSVEQQVCVVNVDYRLATEYPFPTGKNDAYAAVKWTAENAATLRNSLQKGFVLSGDSAGANLAIVCAYCARDDPFCDGRRVAGQLIRQPSVISPNACPERYKSEYRSMEEFKDGPFLTRDKLAQCVMLLQDPAEDPRFSPLLFPSHASLPPAFVTYNGMDPLRDDARLWIKILREAGVKVKKELYPGVGHGFYYSYPTISLASKAAQDTRDGLRWLLAGAL